MKPIEAFEYGVRQFCKEAGYTDEQAEAMIACTLEGVEKDALTAAKGLSKKQRSSVARKARKGGDIGKPGKGFKKVEQKARASGARDPEAVAAAAMWKNVKRKG